MTEATFVQSAYHRLNGQYRKIFSSITILIQNNAAGPVDISAIHSVVPKDVQTRGKDHPEDNHDAEKDEGDGAKGDILKVTAC